MEISCILLTFHELPKMDFQDQFVAITVGKVSTTVLRKENQ